MKQFLTIIYWCAAIFLAALVLRSLEYSLGQAMLIALMFLPGALALAFFLPQVKEEGWRKLLNSAYICLGVLVGEILLIITIHRILGKFEEGFTFMFKVSPMLVNPVFIAAMLTLMALGEYFLERYLSTRDDGCLKPVIFTSGYKKVTLPREELLYIESRDSEVWLHASGGRIFKNRMPISQWENLLRDGFVRIHRSFLVNDEEVESWGSETVVVDGTELPVSRKYKENVLGHKGAAKVPAREMASRRS